MPYETCKQILPPSEISELSLNSCSEVMNVTGRKVTEPGELRMVPDPLIGIELRSVGGKTVRLNVRVPGEELSHDSRVVVDVDPVPDDVQRPLNLAAEISKKADDVLGVNVSVVLEELEVKTKPVALGAYGDGAYGRDSVVSVPALLNRRLATGRERASSERREHEA